MKQPLAFLFVATLLGGCSMTPPYVQPASTVPASWPTGDAYLHQSEAALPSYSYRDIFKDQRLRAVIDQALANNQDVQRALANISAARAQYHVERAGQLPTVNASAGYQRSEGGESGASGANDHFSLQGLVSGYEIDLFGRLRSLSGAAKSRYFASESAARATKLTLVAEVADAWLAYAADSSLLEIAHKTEATAQESERLTQRRLEGGIAPRSDLRQAQIILKTAQADVATQTTAVAQDLNALQLLTGSTVSPANLSTSIDDAGARLTDVPAGLDSTILLRRPDVLEAEWNLRAANYEIGAARAALFPRISLTGVLGFASNALGALFSGGNFGGQVGAGASYPIFQGGAGKANVALSEAQRDAALAAYRKAIQSSFADVADRLARLGTIESELDAVRAGRDAAADNLHLADLRYRGGIDSYLSELTASQALYSAERSFVATQLVRASNKVGLYRALGGDSFEPASSVHSQ